MKKILAILVVFVVFVSSFSLTISALAETETAIEFESPVLYYAASSNHKEAAQSTLSDYITIEELKQIVLNAISTCQENINISGYNIPFEPENYNAIGNYIYYGMPECFNVGKVRFFYSTLTNKLSKITFEYRSFADTTSEYGRCMSEMTSAGDKLLLGIEGNTELTDVQKALLLHDRLALWNKYGYPNDDTIIAHTAYGALGRSISVCQGYAMAYMYLLDRVGIESYYCSSATLEHGWNIVYIDGKPYHVDVTWDDLDWGNVSDEMVGGVAHDNFLLSNSGIYATGHEASDYDTSAKYDTYDDYFWQDSNASFELLNGEIYYIDNETGKLKRYSDRSVICNVDSEWTYLPGDGYCYDFGNNSKLSSDGESLLYSLSDGVYKYDLSNGSVTQVYDAKLTNEYYIYGFTYKNEYLICDIALYTFDESQQDFYIGDLKQVKVKYDAPPPKIVGIEIASLPQKTEYTQGDSFSADGLAINILYSNYTKEKITKGFTISGFNSSTVGEKTVTVAYDKFNVDFIVMVNKYIYDGIGDTDGSGGVDNNDIALLMQYINGWNVSIVIEEADVYSDNTIDNKDFVMLIRNYNGWRQ